MKKLIALLLAAVMCLSLCACGASGKTNSSDTSMNSGNTASQNGNNEMIEFENTVVADDANVTIELVNFYTEEINWGTSTQQEKIVTFRFTNKTGQSIALDPRDFYINNEKAYFCPQEGQGSVILEAGRAGKYSYIIAEDTSPEHTALKSLDELYELEGAFFGTIEYEGSYKYLDDISFSIPKAMNGEITTGNS